MPKVKITVLKKVQHQDLLDEYLSPEAKESGFGICTAFEVGEEIILNGMNYPEGFCHWAWADIQRDVMMVMFGQGFPWVGPKGTAISLRENTTGIWQAKASWLHTIQVGALPASARSESHSVNSCSSMGPSQ